MREIEFELAKQTAKHIAKNTYGCVFFLMRVIRCTESQSEKKVFYGSLFLALAEEKLK